MVEILDVICENLKFSTYGLCLEERPYIPVAEQEVIFHEGIDERDGALTEYGSLKDRTLSLTVNLLGDSPAKSILRKFRGELLALRNFKMRLSDELDIYYLVKSVTMGDINNEIAEYGSFGLSFVIDPFDYKWDVKRAQGVKNLTVQNEGSYMALPVITLTGTGEVVLKTNGECPITISHLNGSVVIDGEKLDYYNPANPSLHTIKVYARNFPELPPGSNTIIATGNVTSLKVEFKERYR